MGRHGKTDTNEFPVVVIDEPTCNCACQNESRDEFQLWLDSLDPWFKTCFTALWICLASLGVFRIVLYCVSGG